MESFDNLSDLCAAIENHGARSHIESRDPLVLSWSIYEFHIEGKEDGFYVWSQNSDFISSNVDNIYIGSISDITDADISVRETMIFFQTEDEMKGTSFI